MMHAVYNKIVYLNYIIKYLYYILFWKLLIWTFTEKKSQTNFSSNDLHRVFIWIIEMFQESYVYVFNVAWCSKGEWMEQCLYL